MLRPSKRRPSCWKFRSKHVRRRRPTASGLFVPCGRGRRRRRRESEPNWAPTVLRPAAHLGSVLEERMFRIVASLPSVPRNGRLLPLLASIHIPGFRLRDWPSIQQYRIRPSDGAVSRIAVSDQVTLTLWNQIMYVLPALTAQWVWTPPTKLPNSAPGLWEFLSHQLCCVVIYDKENFLWHVLHHKNQFLYHHIHSIHHRYLSVNCWTSQYVHPWELFSVHGTDGQLSSLDHRSSPDDGVELLDVEFLPRGGNPQWIRLPILPAPMESNLRRSSQARDASPEAALEFPALLQVGRLAEQLGSSRADGRWKEARSTIRMGEEEEGITIKLKRKISEVFRFVPDRKFIFA